MNALLVLGATTIVSSIAGLALVLYKHGKTIATFLVKRWQAIWSQVFSRSTLFWSVTITFMVFSAYHAAPFYASVTADILGLSLLDPYIGLVAALMFDAIVVVFMKARLRSSYKRDYRRMGRYLRYIIACCAMNTAANLYTNFSHFQTQTYHGFWDIALEGAPILLSLFPMFIVFLSQASEEMSNSTSLEDMDVEAYKKEEQNRVDLLKAQASIRRQEVETEKELILLEKQEQENQDLRRNVRRNRPVFFFGFGKKKVQLLMAGIEAQSQKTRENFDQKLAQIQATFEAQIGQIVTQIQAQNAQTIALQNSLKSLADLGQKREQTWQQSLEEVEQKLVHSLLEFGEKVTYNLTATQAEFEQKLTGVSAETDPELPGVFQGNDDVTYPSLPAISSEESQGQSRKYLMTFEEAAVYTGLSVQALKIRLKKGQIQTGSGGKLLVSSLTKLKENQSIHLVKRTQVS